MGKWAAYGGHVQSKKTVQLKAVKRESACKKWGLQAYKTKGRKEAGARRSCDREAPLRFRC